MRLTSRKWRWFGLVVLVGAIGFGVIRTWVVPAIIVSQIRSRYRGHVAVGNWWFNLYSSGLDGITLREGPDPESPAWFTADRIEANLSIGGLLRGRFLPTEITIDHPQVKILLDPKGQPLTKIPLAEPKGGAGKAAPPTSLPTIIVHDGEVTLDQQGREPMKLTRVEARLTDQKGRAVLEVKTDDPTWGKVAVNGQFDSSFKNGEIQIRSSPDFIAKPDQLRSIPFVPSEVWANLEPNGPVEARVKISLKADDPKPIHVLTDLTLKGTSAKLAPLQVETTETTGHVVIDDAKVSMDHLRGKTVGGSLSASGTLDFSEPIPVFRIDLRLKGVDVAKAPAAWQLNEVGATGKLSGKVDLQVSLRPRGPDLTGTIGEAVIEDGSFQGIPIKSLSIGLRAEGGDLKYETLPEGSVSKKSIESDPAAPPAVVRREPVQSPTTKPTGEHFEIWEPAIAALPILRIAATEDGFLGWVSLVASEVVARQVKQAQGHSPTGGLRLPKTISTHIELEDVDLVTILAKAAKFGIKIPIPVAGKFSIKADATIPIGSLRDIKAYAFHGDATLASASIDRVDVGLVSAHLDLDQGVLDLSDFRGQLVNRPTGNAADPPQRSAAPPKTGELPPGAFRANLKASISPAGPLTATVEARELPLGEILAPVFPGTNPISGELTVRADARGNVANLSEPRSWEVNAKLDSRKIVYQKATLDLVATEIHLKDGRVKVADFSSELVGRPLKAKGDLDLTAPYQFDGQMNVGAWEIADVLAFVPGAPTPSPASGKFDANARAVGTIQPFGISTQGAARVLKATAGPMPLGSVVLQWTTDRETLKIFGLEAHPFGGKVTGDAIIPLSPGANAQASMTLKGIDTAKITSAIPLGNAGISGIADGQLKLSMPLDGSSVEGNLSLVAPDLTIRERPGDGIRVRSLLVNARADKKQIQYEATADSLGGQLRFHGSTPIPTDLEKLAPSAEFQAAGFRLEEAWRGLGMKGAIALLGGRGAVDANLRVSVSPFRLWSRGIFELRDLHYGRHMNLGGLRGNLTLAPTYWKLEGLTGDLFGGLANGEADGTSKPGEPRQINFDFKVDRASLPRMLSEVPILARGAEGFGSLRAAGRLEDALRATAEVQVGRGKILGLVVTDVRFPVDIDLSPTNGVGTIHSRHFLARVAGGSARGNAWARLGADRAFQSEVQLSELDLEVLSRLGLMGKHNASGKVSGKVNLNGPNPNNLSKIRGRIDLDLDDASLVEMPVFKELDRFLGSAKGGGLFEDGDVHGSISNRTLFVESMTLQGRLIQLHASGSITFSGGLDLQVLVNTNDVIPQSGLAIFGAVPGLSQTVGRSGEALMKIANFLENRLLKFRVSGTVSNPVVQIDAGVAVTQGAAGFFSSALRMPMGSR